MATHYFFKFQKKNAKFAEFVEGTGSDVGQQVPLSIYFGKWTVAEWRRHVYGPGGSRNNAGKFPDNLEQIEHFFSIESDADNTLLWVFLHNSVYCLRPVTDTIVDGPLDLVDENHSLPKTLWSEIIARYDKFHLPDVFSFVNANQKYNRKTITPLVEAEERIAEHLYKNPGRLFSIEASDIHRYLSPVQYETLIFLIFVCNERHCSTWRGGTGEMYDMRIDLETPFSPFPVGPSYIQVKKKETDPIKSHGYFVVYCGATDTSRNRVGWDWIEPHVRQSPYIMDWLAKSLDYFEVNW